MFGHAKFEMPIRPVCGKERWATGQTRLELRDVGRLKISFENPQEAGSVTQTPRLLPRLGSSHNRYGKFPVALLRKVETVFLGLSH